MICAAVALQWWMLHLHRKTIPAQLFSSRTGPHQQHIDFGIAMFLSNDVS